MTRITKTAFIAVLALTLLFVLGLGAVAANENQTHLSATTTAMGKCVACHGNKAMSQSLNVTVATAHKLHMRGTTRTMRFGQCQLCHKAADEINDSGSSIRKQVSSTKCLSCHGTFTAAVVEHATSSATATDCLNSACHNSRAEVRKAHRAAKAPVTAKAARIAYCADCHGGSTAVPAIFAAEETNPATW